MLPVLTEAMLAADALLVRQVQVADMWLTLAAPYGADRWLCVSAIAERPDPGELDGEGQTIRPLAACFGARWEDLLAANAKHHVSGAPGHGGGCRAWGMARARRCRRRGVIAL